MLNSEVQPLGADNELSLSQELVRVHRGEGWSPANDDGFTELLAGSHSSPKLDG